MSSPRHRSPEGRSMHANHITLVQTTRGGSVECSLRGSVCVVGCDGRVIAAAGNPSAFTFMRSTAKPFQVMALVEHRDSATLALSSEEIAVMSGSHNAEIDHLRILSGLLRTHGLTLDDLKCGTHPPLTPAAAVDLLYARHERPLSIHHNCSGTHIAIILLARLLHAPTRDYCEALHPAETAITSLVQDFLGGNPQETVTAIDACGIPTYGVSLRRLATAFASLASVSDGDMHGHAARTVRSAMMQHPFLIAGTGRLETDLMRVSPVVAKIGADGVYCVGVPGSRLGVAVKIEAGSADAAKCAAVETLVQLDVLDSKAAEAVEKYRNALMLAPDGRETGTMLPVFSLQVR